MKQRLVALAACAAFVAAGSVSAQQQPSPAQGQGQRQGAPQGPGRGNRDNLNQPATGTASISGVVVSAGSGMPVRRARVMLSGGGLRGARSIASDDQGRFAFTTLPEGRFNLSASKAGYVDIAYGAKKPGRPGTAIQLADGQKLERVTISLPKGSVVTGVVIDETGEPSPGTQVRVMRYVMRTGEKTLQQAGQDTTDDRGIYRVYGLQPGDYMVSAMPRNTGFSNLRESIASEIESLVQQAQASGAGGGGGGRGGRAGGGPGATALANVIAGGGRGQPLLDRASQLQQQLQEQEQTVGYAPVYYPGTTLPASASTVTLGVGEERAGVDFQLQLVPTAKVEGAVTSADGSTPQGVQVMLTSTNAQGMPPVPGVGSNMTRVGPDGRFSFSNVTPGQYTIMARAAIRESTPGTQSATPAQGGGRGGPFGGRGPGGPGAVTQILWGAADVAIDGRNLADVAITLQPGMRVSGRITFESTSQQPPTDLTRVRVTLTSQGQQTFEIGGAIPPAQVDASGAFTINGVAPGRYALRANVAGAGPQAAGRPGGPPAGISAASPAAGNTGAQWVLKSSIVAGRDTLDFPLEIRPNEEVTGAILTFTDQTQDLSGTLQDSSGRPTADYTIVVFPSDNRYWTPQSRRIQSARPGTDGRFTFRNLPAGDYRLTAITDAEPGEWYDPSFLQQLLGASMSFSLGAGEKKTQDLRVAGGGT